MKPFLMSVVSSSDLWLYLSSTGGLTAGRRNYNNALFPYYTDDKIHEAHPVTGPTTIIRVKDNHKMQLWKPFSICEKGLYRMERKLYKNIPGNKVIFEEINFDLQLRFRYAWMGSDLFGWIRKSMLTNLSGKPIEADVCDGLLNILPWGITRETQSMMSTLMDAYKVCEYLPESKMALYYLSSIPVDRAEPSEALRTNTVWSTGLEPDMMVLSHGQLSNLQQGGKAEAESKMVGQKTAFLLNTKLRLEAKGGKNWYIAADVAKDISDVLSLQNLIGNAKDRATLVEESIIHDTGKLSDMVARADGKQKTGDPLNDCRHFSNTLFNIMRGGIFENDYQVQLKDFLDHLRNSNRAVWRKYRDAFARGVEVMELQELIQFARSQNDADIFRLTLEYLPLSFGRRHGDPSRPWNYFDIRVKNPDGSPSLNYQGNWRDIFQNWEALGFSFPYFLSGMITRFLNASTADGYNPYRITRDGFDWEVPEPDNPWASIGYWGDHQINYLLRLMEMQEKFFPGSLSDYFNDRNYVYAQVPYRIRPYSEILADPQDTILFDTELHLRLIERSKAEGNDGKLYRPKDGRIQKAGFMEKILVSLLTKLSNFVPEAGIWLNTQRPEWNDANNALTGNGTSMVSLYHIRRFVNFLQGLIQQSHCPEFVMAKEVFVFQQAVTEVFNQHTHLITKGFSGNQRKTMTDLLGQAGEAYRECVYDGFSGQDNKLPRQSLIDFCGMVLKFLDQAIESNRRPDNLFHSYNLLDFRDDSIEINHLSLMLEGQAAILSSGYLSPARTLSLIKSLFSSDLWRADQQSFMLYPFRNLPGFLDKNTIPREKTQQSELLQQLAAANNTDIICRDEAGGVHFNASLKNANMLKKALNRLPEDIDRDLISRGTPVVLGIYESVFNHRFFTGRSGSFYKYEGLGSIYWHMVSKLLLSLGERIIDFATEESGQPPLPELKKHYYRIKEGLGLHKKPEDYGAFPTDPYSHTPLMMGAQQPGMTGQVKEDILSRFNELGLIVKNGKIHCIPVLLRDEDFSEKGEALFSFCGIDMKWQKGRQGGLEVVIQPQSPSPLTLRQSSGAAGQPPTSGARPSLPALQLGIPEEISEKIFRRRF